MIGFYPRKTYKVENGLKFGILPTKEEFVSARSLRDEDMPPALDARELIMGKKEKKEEKKEKKMVCHLLFPL